MKNAYDYLNDTKLDLSMYDGAELSEKELKSMKEKFFKKKRPLWQKAVALAACAAMVAAFTQTAFAKELWYKLVLKVSTGRNSFYSYEVNEDEAPALIFDAEGNPISNDAEFDENMTYYDADGNVITDMEAYLREKVEELFPGEGSKIRVTLTHRPDTDELTFLEGEGYTVVRGDDALDKAAKDMMFDPITPEKLPEGYSLAGAAYFPTSGKYLTLVYANDEGRELVVFERYLDDETAFASGTDGVVEETEINGHVAALSNGTTLDWEDGDVAIGLHTNGNLERDQIMEMAESFK